MTTASAVPVTRDEELEGDEALETLRSAGRLRLALDAVDRFRAADGFSHSRALAFQGTLTLLPGLIAIVGLAATLDQDTFARVVEETIREIAPGAVGDLLTEALRQGSRSSGELALVGGLIAALIAGTTAMAQIERGSNRIYGVERDRPFLHKYGIAFGLALSAGVLFVLALVALVGGEALKGTVGWGPAAETLWDVLRWPAGIALVVMSVALLLEISPRRRQPEPSWLAVGATVSAVLWLAFMALLKLYVEATEGFGATYGPLAGTIGVLLWTFATSVALFLGVAFAAQLEAVRAGVESTRRDDVAELA
jgi:YihY family inner membrane protein